MLKQSQFQGMKKGTHIHLKLGSDRITSVAIPALLVGTTILMMLRGVWNMSHGTGKKD
nr:uncharacterized protein LOC112272847 [Physcomitrium patens]|eukprot:XP_024356775.1 uncharacterized protein LOC112272847 [Physcomitrella patens]